jgi:general stress protein 26
MDKIDGMLETFRESKQVFLTTRGKLGETNIRAMTNYNESPYEPMWFPTFKDTRKIREIVENKEVWISFSGDEVDKWYRIHGSAKFAPWEEVQKTWKWWFLEWVPMEDRKKSELRYDHPFSDRAIIWVDPIEAEVTDHK